MNTRAPRLLKPMTIAFTGLASVRTKPTWPGRAQATGCWRR